MTRIAKTSLLSFVLFAVGCEVPNLESTECQQARVAAKQFYSFHLANDMTPTVENVRLRQRFLTSRFLDEALDDIQTEAIDPFVGVSPAPTTFRVGRCESRENEAGFEVLFLWKTDAKSEQKSRDVTLKQVEDRWLIDHVGSIP